MHSSEKAKQFALEAELASTKQQLQQIVEKSELIKVSETLEIDPEELRYTLGNLLVSNITAKDAEKISNEITKQLRRRKEMECLGQVPDKFLEQLMPSAKHVKTTQEEINRAKESLRQEAKTSCILPVTAPYCDDADFHALPTDQQIAFTNFKHELATIANDSLWSRNQELKQCLKVKNIYLLISVLVNFTFLALLIYSASLIKI